MNKQRVGQELRSELARGYDIVRISRWAFRVFSENVKSLDPSLRDILENLFSMEDDPQFELTANELRNLADKLIAEGEQEELSKPIPGIKNPFSPGAGSPPPELVGRDPDLEQARILLSRIKQKRSEKSMLLTGLRGVGKTVLLNEIERLAKKDGYLTIFIEAHENKALGPLIKSIKGACTSSGSYF